ncbi:MAG TPA: aminopeptidase P N-terminal domain-containing protein, partial [Polyangiaceae bacterium]
MWPVPSPVTAFAERRRKLQRKLVRSALIASGQAPARNFPANQYPFRASSHFLYFVGRQLPGAVLLMGPGRTALYAPPPDPDQTLWMAQESLGEIEQALELEVRPLDDLPREPEAAAIPPQDAYTASWLSEKLGRPITAGAGSRLKNDRDRELADAVIELRLRHDDAAIGQMRQAAAVSELAHRAGLIGTRPGLREAQV